MFDGRLPHDIMHDVLEGVAPLEMSLLLCHCIISEQYVSLDEHNYRLSHFDYDYTESNEPPTIHSRSVLTDGEPLEILCLLDVAID